MTRKLPSGRSLPITAKRLAKRCLVAYGWCWASRPKTSFCQRLHCAKDFILLVEYALAAEKERKMSRFEALLDATRKRVRPIAITFRLP